MSLAEPLGIICIAFRNGRRTRAINEAADFPVGNRANDTDDTKASSRDTSTIQGITTMTCTRVFNVGFAAKIPTRP
jgi:hypothetical protein